MMFVKNGKKSLKNIAWHEVLSRNRDFKRRFQSCSFYAILIIWSIHGGHCCMLKLVLLGIFDAKISRLNSDHRVYRFLLNDGWIFFICRIENSSSIQFDRKWNQKIRAFWKNVLIAIIRWNVEHRYH